jgi:hypothetical protein
MAGARHGMGTVWARHGMCELAFMLPSELICVYCEELDETRE